MVRRRRARGFTMVELLVSMALASVGLMGLLALEVTATRGNANSRNFLEATSIAQERLEQAQYIAYANLAAAPPTGIAEGTCDTTHQPPVLGSPTTVNVQPQWWMLRDPQSSQSVNPTTYLRCTQVTVGLNTTMVTVQVQWIEQNAGTLSGQLPHTVTLSTVRSP